MRKVLIFISLLGLIVVSFALVTFVFFKTYPGSTLKECDKMAAEKFTGEEAKDFQYSCYADVAGRKGDTTICERIPSEPFNLIFEKVSCYANVALKREDLAVCDLLAEVETKDWCLRNVSSACRSEKLVGIDERPVCKVLRERGFND